jgi:hypothetical protein
MSVLKGSYIKFAVLSAVLLKNAIYCSVTPRSENQASASAGFLHGLFFEPEDGVNILLRNVGLSLNYTALQPRRPYPF